MQSRETVTALYLRAHVDDALSHFDYETAVFLAERLHALPCNEAESGVDSALVLATAYFRQGATARAHHVLTRPGVAATAASNTRSSHARRLLLAHCCFDARDYAAAEEVLLGTSYRFVAAAAAAALASL
jgi:hypothetical protein